MTNVVAIHQPNFFPWLGYFDKINSADTFIFLDDVQFPKKGGTWTNRVKLIVGDEASWFTAAIERNYHGTKKINDMFFQSQTPWRSKLIKTLINEYRKHSFFNEVIRVVEPLFLNPENNISAYNIHAITALANILDFNTSNFTRSSDFLLNETSNQLLCSITLSAGGDSYLNGGGATGYLDESIFNLNGLNLIHQNFIHPVYKQNRREDFISGLSIIDIAMNIGWDGLRDIFHKKNND